MTVNVNLKKMLIVVALIFIAVGGVWKYMEGAPARRAKAEVETMVDYAQRQALEIAIIEQSSKLADYKRQLAKNQSKPLPPNPFAAPVPKDPNDSR